MNELDLKRIRNDIKQLDDKIFLNSAGSSLPPDSVWHVIHDYHELEATFGGYKAADLSNAKIDDFYTNAAQLLGCQPRNIAFTNNATDSYLKALLSYDYHKDDVIITSDDDYASNYIHFISLQKRYGIKILRIANLENGDLDISDFENLLDTHSPKLVSISHIPTNSGLIQQVEPVGEICQERGIPFLLDACQSAGQLKLDVNELKCDFLSLTGRKFLRGPRGTGILYVADRVLESNRYPVTIDGRGAIWNAESDYRMLPDAKRYEMWEKPFALLLGLSEAIRYANEIGLHTIQSYNSTLMTHFRDKLGAVDGVKIYDRGSRKGNILTFRKEGKSLRDHQSKLDHHNILYSVSEKEWGFIDFNKKKVDWVVRLSPHYFNTMEEIDQVSHVIDSI